MPFAHHYGKLLSEFTTAASIRNASVSTPTLNGFRGPTQLKESEFSTGFQVRCEEAQQYAYKALGYAFFFNTRRHTLIFSGQMLCSVLHEAALCQRNRYSLSDLCEVEQRRSLASMTGTTCLDSLVLCCGVRRFYRQDSGTN